MAKNVELIDPNEVNINTNIVNGIPQYQDMFIEVYLRAIERGRTVLETTINGDITKIDRDASGTEISIGMLGENQDETNRAHFGQFTTNYYDGSIPEGNVQYEGFGINNIDIVVNSSYIPQINIEFIDVRGLAFFNRKNSPYRVLFEFPPPIFTLSFKGYYGKSLSYQMHLVKYTTEFKSDTGNYHINCEFIAISYAPLTDIPFRYIVQAPLINNDESINSNKGERPKNTLDFIFKLENLLTGLKENLNNDQDNVELQDATEKLREFSSVEEILVNYSIDTTLQPHGEPILFIRDEAPDSQNKNEIITIENFNDYDSVIEEFGVEGNPRSISSKLYLGYLLESDINIYDIIDDPDQRLARTLQDRVEYEALNKYREETLIEKTRAILGPIVNNNDISLPQRIFYDRSPAGTNQTDGVRFIALDLTQYYVKVFKERARLRKQKSAASASLNNKINEVILENLGMKPTIYNVFELLLNDVDIFFQKLRNTSESAENDHHVKYFDLIVNDRDSYKDFPQKVFAFPLIIKTETICNQKREERVGPIDLSSKLPEPFPELVFVNDFIDSMLKYKRLQAQRNQKAKEDARGNNLWIPFTPADSIIGQGTTLVQNLNSPYLGVDTAGGGSQNNTIEINTSDYPKLTQIFRILLERFYVLSESVIPYTFFNVPSPSIKKNNLYKSAPETNKIIRDLFAKSEAVNLINSLTNNDLLELLRNFSTDYARDVNGFLQFLNQNASDLYSDNTQTEYGLSNGPSFYVNNEASRFRGFSFITDLNRIVERTPGGESKFIDNFISTIYDEGWDDYIVKKRKDDNVPSHVLTKENIIFVPDEAEGEGEYVTYYAATLNDLELNYYPQKNEIEYGKTKKGVNEFYSDLVTNGNRQFFEDNAIGKDRLSNRRRSLLQNWVFALESYGPFIYNDIINFTDSTLPYSNEINNNLFIAMIYLSNFGTTLSPFNYYPNYLNRDLFSIPSIVELPKYVSLYLGALITILDNDEITINSIIEWFKEPNAGYYMSTTGGFIVADLINVRNLSLDDKNILKTKFEEWFGRSGGQGSDFYRHALGVKNLYDSVMEDYAEQQETIDDAKSTFLGYNRGSKRVPDIYITFGENENSVKIANAQEGQIYLRPNINYLFSRFNDELGEGGIFENILKNLTRREGMLVYSELSFDLHTDDENNPIALIDINNPNIKYYRSLATINNPENNTFLINANQLTENYFSTFLTAIVNNIDNRIQNIRDEEREFDTATRDTDIINQTYYSFKNINDKWLAGTNKNVIGYPFKTNPQEGLISQFAFVDRAMRPIGDTIINAQALLDNLESPDASIFTVISQMLSQNGFEFFPLQSFMSFTENEWRDSFKIDTGPLEKQYPVFVCMYIGGSSSYPTGIGDLSPFEDDGIVDLKNPGVDIFGDGCEPNEDDDNQLNVASNTDLYSTVRAFRVRYAEQNQSMFYDIKIDSKEYPETNESIQILSQLAGDNGPQAPIPKGQNLYSIYENRAYKATVIGLGNAMIQPTQYFQLENIPLFDGAYVVLTVEHNIVANKMTTKFSGTKLLKYPMPRVLNPAAIIGFEGGVSDETDVVSSEQDIVSGAGVGGNPPEAEYNSMYTLEIGY